MEAQPEPRIKSYRDLMVWQKSMDLVVECYTLVKKLPSDELYGLVSQIRRASVSVPANIAEGHGRRQLGDYVHHLHIASGSLTELETHLLISVRLNYLHADEIKPVWEKAMEIGRMLTGLIEKLSLLKS
ncbi:MAG TPA: four helix bundle protein [Candidatus Acidoferrales bacterium]|nr:four helix bundle protein [Candidatus Acidoferrales bacterium]